MLSMRTYGCDVFCTEQNRIFVLLEGLVAPHQLMVKTMKRETPDTKFDHFGSRFYDGACLYFDCIHFGHEMVRIIFAEKLETPTFSK